MGFRTYCLQIKRKTTLLDETEWQSLRPLLDDMIRGIKEYREATGAGIWEAKQNNPRAQIALDHYTALTGDELDQPDQLWAVRMSAYGKLCPQCEKPYRRSRAKMCAECGFTLPSGEVAGPLMPTEIKHETP